MNVIPALRKWQKSQEMDFKRDGVQISFLTLSEFKRPYSQKTIAFLMILGETEVN